MAAVVVFHAEAAEGFAAFGDAVFGLGDDAGEGEVAAVELFEFLELGQGAVAEVFDLQPVIIQRVAAEVEADDLFFVVQLFEGAPAFDPRQGRLGDAGGRIIDHVEHAYLRGVGAILMLLAVAHEGLHVGGFAFAGAEEEVRALCAEAIEGARVGHAFQSLSVGGTQVHAAHEVVDGGVGAVLPAVVDDGFDGAFAHAFYGTKTEPDLASLVDAEFVEAFVHVGAQYFDAHAAALFHEKGDLFDAALVVGEHAGHVFGRVVGLEPRGLVGDEGVARAVRFVEGVLGEGLPVRPHFFAHFLVEPLRGGAFEELALHLVQRGPVLFAHGLAQDVGIALGEAGELLGEQHHLFLVDGDAVRFLQVFLHLGQVVADRLQPVFALDEVGDVFQRARPVERGRSGGFGRAPAQMQRGPAFRCKSAAVKCTACGLFASIRHALTPARCSWLKKRTCDG